MDPAAEHSVSFVIPVFNKRDFLPALVGSLRAQRGDFAREYVFIDDGSTDGGLALLRALTAELPATRIATQPNAGSAAATNHGIRLARHRFIKFVDADDLLHPDCTARLLAALAPSAAGLAWCERVAFRPGETPVLDGNVADAAPVLLRDALAAVLHTAMFNPTQMLVRTALAQQVGGCDERIIHSQEYSLSLRLSLRAPFLHLPVPLAYVCEGVPGSLSAHQGRQLARTTHAHANLIAEHPELPAAMVRLAVRRAASRAYNYGRRQRGEDPFPLVLLRYLRTRLPGPLPREPAAFIRRCAASIAAVPLREVTPASLEPAAAVVQDAA